MDAFYAWVSNLPFPGHPKVNAPSMPAPEIGCPPPHRTNQSHPNTGCWPARDILKEPSLRSTLSRKCPQSQRWSN